MTVEPHPTIRGSSDRLTDGFQGLNCASLRSEAALASTGVSANHHTAHVIVSRWTDASELQRAWQRSESSSWLPSQCALPTGRQLARCCRRRFRTAPAIIAGEAGRATTGWGNAEGEDAGCQIAPFSPAHRDVKSAAGPPPADLYAYGGQE